MCNNCHNRPFPGVYHPYRINVSAATPTLAGIVDIDQACGRCHGGGTAQVSTTGSIAAGTRALDVSSPAGFLVGARVVVAGAGIVVPSDPESGNLESRIVSISGSQLTLGDDAARTVAGASVVQSPTSSGAPYYTKVQLGPVAKGMHDGPSYPVTFVYTVTPDTLQVNVDAQVGCSVDCPAFSYDWDWGDATAHGSAASDSHDYSTSGAKTITLALYASGRSKGSGTRSLTLKPVDLPPMAAGTCTWNADSWTETLVDASDDDGPDDDAIPGDGTLTVSVDWGDGTLKSIGSKGGTFTHSYLRPGSYTIGHKVVDSTARMNSRTCGPVSPAYFTISGTVRNKLGTAPLAYATVRVSAGATIVKTLSTAADGSFTAGAILKPGAYTLSVTKSGYTFASPAASMTIGPNGARAINATGP
jgi:hypothetical protein